MLQIDNYIHATSILEAYETLNTTPGSVVLGGCGYLRLADRRINTAIDLSHLELDYIKEQDATIEIGTMTSLRKLETDALIRKLCNGVLVNSVKDIVGVQLRSCVTVGGTIAGRYPFSDLITALLALDTRLKFHKNGLIRLQEYLTAKSGKDILEKIIIPNDGRRAAFASIRKTQTDYAVLNVAVAKKGDEYRIVVGSRPGRAIFAEEAADYLQHYGLNEETALKAAKIATDTLKFGDNPRGSAAYRRAICPVLIQRALKEVIHAA